MELAGVPQKIDQSSPWDLYSMYVVLQGIGSLNMYLYKGIYIYVIPFSGVTTLDV